jgi:hypothetical protein
MWRCVWCMWCMCVWCMCVCVWGGGWMGALGQHRLELEGDNWRKIYKALVVIDYLLKNSIKRVVEDVKDPLMYVTSSYPPPYVREHILLENTLYGRGCQRSPHVTSSSHPPPHVTYMYPTFSKTRSSVRWRTSRTLSCRSLLALVGLFWHYFER